MTTDEMRALPEWPMIQEVIDKTIESYREIDSTCTIELVDRGTMFVIVVDGEDEIGIDASILS